MLLSQLSISFRCMHALVLCIAAAIQPLELFSILRNLRGDPKFFKLVGAGEALRHERAATTRHSKTELHPGRRAFPRQGGHLVLHRSVSYVSRMAMFRHLHKDRGLSLVSRPCSCSGYLFCPMWEVCTVACCTRYLCGTRIPYHSHVPPQLVL